jgi:hypothetical protein
MGAPNTQGWTSESWESAMAGLLDRLEDVIDAADDPAAKQKKMRKKSHGYKPIKGKGSPCLLCGLGSGAPVHNDPDNDGDNDPAGVPDKDAKAPASSHRTCKSCGAHMAQDAGTCQSCGAKWSASDALEDKKAPSGANAPYKIFAVDGGYEVRNNAGEVKAKFDTRAKALKYLRALYVNVSGAGKRAEKVDFTGKAKQRIPKKG